VSQNLGLTPQQLNQLNQANQELQGRFQRESGQVRINDPRRNQQLQDMRNAYNAELNQSAGTIMTPEQLNRYRQLVIQNRGFDAFADAEVQRRLELTNAQLQRLQLLSQQNNQQLQGFVPNGPPDWNEFWRRYHVWRQQQLNGILNQQQQQAWS